MVMVVDDGENDDDDNLIVTSMADALRPVGPGVLLPSLGSRLFVSLSFLDSIDFCFHMNFYQLTSLKSLLSLLSFFETFFLFFVLVGTIDFKLCVSQ